MYSSLLILCFQLFLLGTTWSIILGKFNKSVFMSNPLCPSSVYQHGSISTLRCENTASLGIAVPALFIYMIKVLVKVMNSGKVQSRAKYVGLRSNPIFDISSFKRTKS